MFRCGKQALLGAALVAGLSMPALGADIYEPPVEVPVYKESFGGWYLRGHIGMSNQQLGSLYNVLFDGADTTNFVLHDKNFEAGAIFGGGIGYQFNSWFRADLTAEYRGETGFHGFDTWNDAGNGGAARFNDYTAKKSEWLFLANAYADLGEWHGIVPYIGAGVGASRNTIHSFRDEGRDPTTGDSTMAYADSDSKWNFAWALHAGVGFRATENLTIDFGYSYVDLGDAQSGDIIASDRTNTIDNPMHFRDITSHDVKLGIRYAFN